MNGPFDEELLSAYHDGELPESDRQPVADRIAEDSELRELLDDYAELSGALKSLPRPEAPADLNAAVMSQVRDSAVVRPKRETPRPSRRKLWLWTAGTAASLLLAAGLFVLSNDPPGGSGAQLAQNDSEEIGDIAPSVAEERAEAGGFGGGGTSLQMAQVEEMPADETRRSMDSRALESHLQELLRLDDLEPGQQLHVLQSIDDELVLIEFQVVDVDVAFGEVQVLLNELEISKLAASDEETDRIVAASESRLRGILVDASPETMLAALDRIDQLESVVVVDTNGADMALELGVEPERIPERMHQQHSVASAAPTADAALEPDSTALPPAAQSSAVAASGAQIRPGAAFTGGGQAYQVPLSLSGDVVREIEMQLQQQARQQAPSASREGSAQRDAQVLTDGQAAVAEGGRTRSRILLIFKTESVPGTP